MSRSFAVEATISQPAEQVWQALTDWSNAQRWMAGVDSLKADGATAVGTKVSFHTRGRERTATIAKCRPGRSLVLRSVQGGVTADYEYAVEALGDGTSRVTLVADCQMRGLVWRAMGPLIRMAIRKTDGGQLEALKQVIEGA